jgi:hypothetical protein
MHHIGMRTYFTAIALFVSSLLAQATASRESAQPRKAAR